MNETYNTLDDKTRRLESIFTSFLYKREYFPDKVKNNPFDYCEKHLSGCTVFGLLSGDEIYNLIQKLLDNPQMSVDFIFRKEKYKTLLQKVRSRYPDFLPFRTPIDQVVIKVGYFVGNPNVVGGRVNKITSGLSQPSLHIFDARA